MGFLFRLIKYFCLVMATYFMQHAHIELSLLMVLIASLCDYEAQVVLMKKNNKLLKSDNKN